MQLAALDIGTQNIKLLAADFRGSGSFKIQKILNAPSNGVRKGAIYDLDETVASLNPLLSVLRKEFRSACRNIYVNVNGPQISSRISKGIIAVSRADSEIYKDDIDRVIKASQAVNISPNRKIIHTITREFVVDGIKDIPDPAGLYGSRLEVESVVVDVFAPYLKNLAKAIEVSGGHVGGFVLGNIASSEAVLTKRQKELGVALVDIGAQTTGFCVYEENKLLHASILPMGASHITNDLAVGFKIPVHDAENLKLNFGYAISKQIPPKEIIEATFADGSVKNSLSRRFLSEIVESRLAEIFNFINDELKSINRNGQLPAGVVLTGGGAKLPGIVNLAKQELRLSCQIGVPVGNFEISDQGYNAELEDPEFACASGLLLLGVGSQDGESLFPMGGVSFTQFIKSFFSNLLP
ncbi:MAG: cell division protein FtsA [Candidatus Liptonbacteria bacterium]|nr:cell division protein FtsA [Candidatus Liptonbacteria bacterium]